MSSPAGQPATTALVPARERELLSSPAPWHSDNPARKRRQPAVGLYPEEIQAVIAAAACERDQLLLTMLWATGARIGEALAQLTCDVRRRGPMLSNRRTRVIR